MNRIAIKQLFEYVLIIFVKLPLCILMAGWYTNFDKMPNVKAGFGA